MMAMCILKSIVFFLFFVILVIFLIPALIFDNVFDKLIKEFRDINNKMTVNF